MRRKCSRGGQHLWNAGIFLFTTTSLIEAFKAHAPALLEQVGRAVDQAPPDLAFCRLAPEPWAEVEPISTNYAVMEKSENLTVVPYAGAWSNLGGWDAVWRDSDTDVSGVVVQGTAKVTVDDTVSLVAENQSIYVPLGAVHRMENPGKVDMVLIEVQSGSYLDEDDIEV